MGGNGSKSTRRKNLQKKNGKKKHQLDPKSLNFIKRDVDFTDEEIKGWFEEYQDSLRHGKTELTRDEFKKVYNSLFQGDASEFAEQVFRTFDRDGSDTVDFQEFVVGLCVSGSSDMNRKLEWAFKMYDINGDGSISREEMRRIVKAIFTMTNASTSTSPGELSDDLFDQLDRNGDGKISREEFQQGAKKDPIIVQLLECNPEGH